ncbi:MAG TPA: c-type cytochrome [Chromatiaceae bacterium]|nr:c-type cytochrome [Chromatiaceae bacterium]
MPSGLHIFLGWTAGTAGWLAVLSGASLAALAAVPPVLGSSPVPAAEVAVTAPAPVTPERALALRHFLTQDCGSCHGLTLGGGLGPPLQREQVANKPVPYLAYTILNGRPGTAMPPWSRFLTEAEGEWLARELRGENP